MWGKILGDDVLDVITQNIDNLVKTISTTRSYTRTNQVKNIDDITRLLDIESDRDLIKLLEYLIGKNTSRLEKYNAIDYLYNSLLLCRRVVRIYAFSILQKNPLTGKFYVIRPSKPDVQNFDTYKTKLETLLKDYNILHYLKYKWLPLVLKYGDVFVEVINLDSFLEKEINKINKINKNQLFRENDDIDAQLSQLILETNSPQDEVPSNHKLGVYLRTINPKSIEILHYGDTILGYLEVYESPLKSNSFTSQSIVKALIDSPSALQTFDKHALDDEYLKKFLMKFTEKIIQKSLNNKSFSIYNYPSLIQSIVNIRDHYVKTYLTKLVAELRKNKRVHSQLKIRFIPADSIIHFCCMSSDFYPYGSSVLEPLMFIGKLYLITRVANLLIKISRAPVIRKWYLEEGITRQTSNLAQQFERELRNKRVTLESLMKVGTFPNILSDFRDFIFITKGNQRFLDLEVSAIGDPNVKTDDIEELKREFVNLSGIPSTYLGIVDTDVLKEQLVHTNVVFASDISDMQESISTSIMQLLDILAKYEYNITLSEYATFSLIPPTALTIQLLEMVLSSVNNIIGVMKQLGVPVDAESLLREMVPYLDIDKIIKQSKVKAASTVQQSQQQTTGF